MIRLLKVSALLSALVLVGCEQDLSNSFEVGGEDSVTEVEEQAYVSREEQVEEDVPVDVKLAVYRLTQSYTMEYLKETSGINVGGFLFEAFDEELVQCPYGGACLATVPFEYQDLSTGNKFYSTASIMFTREDENSPWEPYGMEIE